jgi:inner membrane protein
MPSPIAHAVTGYAIAQLFSLKTVHGQEIVRRVSGLSLGLYSVGMAIAADLDFIPQFITGVKFHHGPTHSIAFAIAVAFVACGFQKVWPDYWPKSIFRLTLALYGSHLLLDFFTDGGDGIQVFWPVNLGYWRSPVALFPSTHWSKPLFYPGHFLFLAYELGYSFCVWLGLKFLKYRDRQSKWQKF